MSGSASSGVFEIPIQPSLMQTMSISLVGVTYNLTFLYHDASQGGWTIDIADANGNPLACGLPLVSGEDILEQFAYLGIGGKLILQTDGDPTGAVSPGFNDLGVGATSHLYFVPD